MARAVLIGIDRNHSQAVKRTLPLNEARQSSERALLIHAHAMETAYLGALEIERGDFRVWPSALLAAPGALPIGWDDLLHHAVRAGPA